MSDDVHAVSDGSDVQTDAHPDDISEDSGYAPSEHLRPNKWTGDPDVYRSLIRSEQQLLDSIKQIEAGDLGIHLYNAHAIRRHAWAEDVRGNRKMQTISKERWLDPRTAGGADVEGLGDDAGEEAWKKARHFKYYMDDDWTAWPLEPELVPRDLESHGMRRDDWEDEKDTIRGPRATNAVEEMQELLLAEVTRMARQKFLKRGISLERPERRRKRRRFDQSTDGMTSSGAEKTAGNLSEGGYTTVRSTDDDSGSNLGGEDSGDSSDESMKDIDESSTAAGRGEREEKPGAKMSYRPAFLADDGEALNLCLPFLSRTMAKLDELLVGLHKSRLNHIPLHIRESMSRPKPGSNSETDIDSQSDSQSYSDTSSRSSPYSSSGTSRASSSSEDDTEENNHDSGDSQDQSSGSSTDTDEDHVHHTKSNSSKQSSREILNARDWSEVLGSAALLGWDPAAIRRAAARCEKLFGEKMEFQTFPPDDAA